MQCWAPKSSGREGGARGIPKNSTGAEGKGAQRENTSWDQEPLNCGELLLLAVNWNKIVNWVKIRRASLRRSLGLPSWNCWQELWRGRLTQGQRSRSKYRRCSRLLAVEYKSRLQMLQALEVHIPKVMEGEEDFLGSETMVVILGLTVNNWRWSLHNYCVKVRLETGVLQRVRAERVDWDGSISATIGHPLHLWGKSQGPSWEVQTGESPLFQKI